LLVKILPMMGGIFTEPLPSIGKVGYTDTHTDSRVIS
jgi:hypothetical protein